MAHGSDDFSSDRLTLDWAIQSGENGTDPTDATVTGGVFQTKNVNVGFRRTAETYTADQRAQATFLPASGFTDISVRVRCASGGRTYYAGGSDPNDSANSLYRIWMWNAGVWTSLANHPTQVPVANDVVLLRVSGANLSLTVNGIVILTVTDSTLASGQPGMGGGGAAPLNLLDNFSASDEVINTTITPNSGTLSLSRGPTVLAPLAGVLAAVGVTAAFVIMGAAATITPAAGALTATGQSGGHLNLTIQPGFGGGVTPALPTTFATPYVTPGGSTINVAAGGSLQTAITNANPGDIIVVDVANVSGPINLPNKGGSSYIYIVSSALANMPEGVRVGAGAPLGGPFPAATAAFMPKITVTDTTPAITCDAGAHHYRFVGFEISTTWAVQTATNFGIVALEAPFPGNQVLSDQPHHIIFDRCYVHGTPTGNCRRGILGNGTTIAVLDSYISDIHEVGADSQAFAAWNGAGPFKLINNYLEAAGENSMFGGQDPLIANLVPSDIEFRHNYAYKLLSWFVNDPSYAGNRWTIKNLFELKNAQRVLADSNTFNRQSHGDAGQFHAIVFTVRNQGGTAPWSIVADVTFTNNVIQHVGGGWDVLGNDNNFPSQRAARILVRNNVWDIDGIAWGGRGDFCQLAGGDDITVDHNTAFHGNGTGVINNAPILFTISENNPPITAVDICNRLIFTNNICNYGSGFFGDEGIGLDNTAFATYAPGIVLKGNAIVAGNGTNLPAGNFYPVDLNAVGFLSLANFPDVRLAPSSPFVGQATDGQDIGWLFANPPVGVQNQQLALVGQVAIVSAQGPILMPPAGALALTGTAVVRVGGGALITPSTGALAVTGGASSYAIQAIPRAGTLLLNGQTSTVTISLPTFTPGTGPLTLTGSPPGLRIGQFFTPPSGSLNAVGGQATVVVGTPGSVTITPSTGILRLDRGSVTLTPTAGVLALTGLQPVAISPPPQGLTPSTGQLFFGDVIGPTPLTGTLALTGGQAGVGVSITPTTGALALVGQQQPVVVPGVSIVPVTGALALTSNTPVLSFGTILAPSTGALALVGSQPSSGIVFIPGTGALTLAGVPVVVATISFTPGTATLTLTGGTASSPGLSFTTTPGAGTLTFAGQAVLPSLGFVLQPVQHRPIPNYIRRLRLLGVR